MTVLGSALAFARRGHPVLPLTWPINVNGRLVCCCRKAADCGPASAKHPYGPLVSRGLLDASTDEAVVRRWFADEPAANLGVRTDRLVVLDRRRQAAERIVTAMQCGVRLHLQYERGRALWRLSSGSFVPADVAAIAITKTCAVSVGDTLFNDLPPQTWRITDD